MTTLIEVANDLAMSQQAVASLAQRGVLRQHADGGFDLAECRRRHRAYVRKDFEAAVDVLENALRAFTALIGAFEYQHDPAKRRRLLNDPAVTDLLGAVDLVVAMSLKVNGASARPLLQVSIGRFVGEMIAQAAREVADEAA